MNLCKSRVIWAIYGWAHYNTQLVVLEPTSLKGFDSLLVGVVVGERQRQVLAIFIAPCLFVGVYPCGHQVCFTKPSGLGEGFHCGLRLLTKPQISIPNLFRVLGPGAGRCSYCVLHCFKGGHQFSHGQWKHGLKGHDWEEWPAGAEPEQYSVIRLLR